MEGGNPDLIKSNDDEKRAAEDAGKKRKTKLIRLKQLLIDEMMSMPLKPEKRAITERIMAYEACLIQQYLVKGYAEVEEEVTDDEDEEN